MPQPLCGKTVAGMFGGIEGELAIGRSIPTSTSRRREGSRPNRRALAGQGLRPKSAILAALLFLTVAGWSPRPAESGEDDGRPPAEAVLKARVATHPITIDGVLRPEEWPNDPEST